ncbi:hypothetical protein [Nonomuraea sp. NPDC048916]|uniref:hypothetical protein n=1 Tax=Nonomuraea sp. NPDC048916 TaxID=3154232 RepID=UPI0033EFF762
MIRSWQEPCPSRTITPPRRDRDGGFSPAWLLIQAARLSWEIRNILQLINGMRLNLGEELQIQREASDVLANAAHATAIMEARLPLAPAWSSGPPRARSIFAQAREAGTDPAEVSVQVAPPRPTIDPQIIAEVKAALRDDPDPEAQCAGTTAKKDRCAKTIVKGIGSEHCSVHLTLAERRRRDNLRAAQDRQSRAVEDALEDQRLSLATTWIDRYGRRPHRLELPSPAGRPRQVASLPGRTEFKADPEELAILTLYASGWPTLCPRSAEIISALMDCPHPTTARLAEIAAAQAPKRWAGGEQWLDSSIWDGVQPPALALPAADQAPELDEYPPVRVLRHRLDDDQNAWRRWQTGFATLVEACDDPPVDTMAELLAFWQDIGILIPHGSDAGQPIWAVDASLPSPWRVVYTRGTVVPAPVLVTTLDWLLEEDVPVDDDLPPRELFQWILTSGGNRGDRTAMLTGGVSSSPA